MTKYIHYIIAGTLVLLAVVGVITLKNSYDKKYYRLVGEYGVLQELYRANMQKAVALINSREQEIEKLKETVENLNKSIASIQVKIADKDVKLSELESSLTGETDKDKIIVNLESQVNIWKDKFTLATKIIAEKDEIIFSLTKQYEAQLSITEQYKARLDDQIRLNKNMTELLGTAQKRLALQGLGIKVGGGVTAVLAGIVVYSVIRK